MREFPVDAPKARVLQALGFELVREREHIALQRANPDGTVTPRSCYRGFEAFSFGQKRDPSPFATARVAELLRRFDPIASDIAAVDVHSLAGSKGGTGTPVAPRT